MGFVWVKKNWCYRRILLFPWMNLKGIWNDFISDDIFRRRYRSLQVNGNTPIGFICVDKRPRFSTAAYKHGFVVEKKFLYMSENYIEKEELECFDYLKTFGYVIAASKDLLLVGHNLHRLSVYDLVSKKHFNLPRNNIVRGEKFSLGFKCEERSSSNYHLWSSFKVVCVDSPCKGQLGLRKSQIDEIYSSETGTWQNAMMKSELFPFQIWYQHAVKVIRGVFYWHIIREDAFIAYDSEDTKGHVVFIEVPMIKQFIPHMKIVNKRWTSPVYCH